MIKFFILSLYFVIQPSQAKLPDFNNICESKLIKIAKKWGVKGKWRRVFSADMNKSRKYRVASKSFGRWIEVSESENKLQAQLITPKDILQVSFSGIKCTAHISRSTNPTYVKQMKFINYLDKIPQGLVYMWSPNMPVSVYGLKEALKAAKKHNLKVIPILHPSSSVKAAIEVAKENKWPQSYATKINTPEVIYLNLNIHPPSLALFKNGKWVGGILPGAEGADGYASYFKTTLSL